MVIIPYMLKNGMEFSENTIYYIIYYSCRNGDIKMLDWLVENNLKIKTTIIFKKCIDFGYSDCDEWTKENKMKLYEPPNLKQKIQENGIFIIWVLLIIIYYIIYQ